MSSKAEVYEVQTLNHGRWTIQSRCRTEEQAVAEAHEYFDRRQCIGVKVVKEAFDEAAKLYREYTVYRLPSSTAAPKNGSGDSVGVTLRSKQPDSPTNPQPHRRRSLLDLITVIR